MEVTASGDGVTLPFATVNVTQNDQRRMRGTRRRRGAVRYAVTVSPTVLRIRGYRFYFFSREEPRAHVHVQHAEGEAKFWLEPRVEVEGNYGLRPRRLAEALKLVEEHADEFRRAWSKHFPR